MVAECLFQGFRLHFLKRAGRCGIVAIPENPALVDDADSQQQALICLAAMNAGVCCGVHGYTMDEPQTQEKGQMNKVLPIRKSEIPVKSWEVFNAARSILGLPVLQGRFGNRSTTQLYRWGRNPEFSSDWERNPIDWLRGMLTDLAEAGEQELAADVVRIIAEPLGLTLVQPGETQPGHGDNIHGQFTEVFKALNLMLQLAENREHPNLIDRNADKAGDEIRQFKTIYRNLFCAEQDVCGSRFSRAEMSSPGFWMRFLTGGNDDHGNDTRQTDSDEGPEAA